VTSGAALVRFLLSSGGIAGTLFVLILWTRLRPHAKAARVCLMTAAVAYVLLSVYPLPHAAAQWLARPFHSLQKADVPPGETAVVLLGSGNNTAENWSGDRYSVLDSIGTERALEAFRVYRLLDARWIISSGGQPDPEDHDQPAGVVMQTVLTQMGVPAERILIEQQSRTTRDEAVIVAGMLQTLHVEHVVLVTSGLHMRRALAVFRGAGIFAIPAIARETPHTASWLRNVLPTDDGLDESQYVLHEILGLAYYALRGWRG
jgi:uncharacterized SAM-binding protein YcdF (DUF218 family)